MIHHNYKTHLKSYSQKNRKFPTKSEGLVWNCILKQDKTGYRFLRQKPIEGFILDFYCPKLKLGIEIDGKSHENKGDYDTKRIERLNNLGIKIIRYHDSDIFQNLEAVIEDIKGHIKELSKNPPS